MRGSELRVGDTIEVWWTITKRGQPPNKDTITGLRPYEGPLKHLFPEGAQLADFMYLRCGMTIENHHDYVVIGKSNRSEP